MTKQPIRLVLSVLAGVLFYVFALGCDDPYTYQAPTPVFTDTTNMTRKAVRGGFIPDPTITIAAEDGSFTYTGGSQFEAGWNSDLWTCFRGKGDLIDKAEVALRCGAKRVDIKVNKNGEEKTYYGILALNTAVESAYGPASRSYLIRIPDDKWNLANNGNTVAVFEYMKYAKTGYWSNGRTAGDKEQNMFSWILWISTYPIR